MDKPDQTPLRCMDCLTATVMRPEAIAAMRQALSGVQASPDSTDGPGRELAARLDLFRTRLCEVFECGDAILCGSGSEANLRSLLALGRICLGSGRDRIITSPVEHISVVEALRSLVDLGFSIEVLPIGASGAVAPEDLDRMLGDRTGIVTIELASAVSGIVQPVGILADLADRAGALFHCNTCAAASLLQVSLCELHADSASLSARKLGGPPGVGAVLLSGPDLLETSPEFLPVSSSVNLPGAEGMMAAVEARESGGKSRARIADTLRRELLRSLERKGVGFSVVGGNAEAVPGSALLELSEVPCPDLWARIERAGILLASPFSARRLAYLRSLGLDYGHPGRYLGVFLSDNCSMVDVEVLAGTVASALCGS